MIVRARPPFLPELTVSRFFLRRTAFAVAAVVSTGCAGRTAPVARPSPQQEVASGDLGAAFIEWVGDFKATQKQSGDMGPRARIPASGKVRLFAVSESQTHVSINLLLANNDLPPLHWSIASGPCRADAIPLMPVLAFPVIEMHGQDATLATLLPLPIPTTGSYHVNVFWGNGGDESDVMVCANLQMQRRGAGV